jgi:acyl carrier protein
VNDVFERIRELVAEKVGVEPEDISMETSFTDDLEADSITLFELVMAIEDEFDIEVDDESIEKIETVGDIVKYLEDIII